MLSHHVEFHIAITKHISDWLKLNHFSNPSNSSNLSSVPVRIFCFVIHIISGISSRLRGHFYFIDNSTFGLVTRLRTGIPRSSLKRLQFLYLLSYTRLSYPLSAASVPSKRCTLVFRALPRGKALLSTPLTLRCFQSR